MLPLLPLGAEGIFTKPEINDFISLSGLKHWILGFVFTTPISFVAYKWPIFKL
jgi:hypothetical protein